MLMYEPDFYFDRVAAAFVRGLRFDPDLAYPSDDNLHLNSPLEDLSDQDCAEIVQSAINTGLRLHRFHRSYASLPRIARVLTLLQGIDPGSVLDLGCGKGAFLWPFLQDFPRVPVTAVDKEESHIAPVRAVARGGVERLRGAVEDATRLPFADALFDVVAMLEVVEHVPEAMRALQEALRVAKRLVVISVPNRVDEPAHRTHLFSADRLSEMLMLAGAARVTIDLVGNHLIAMAKTARAA